MREETRDRMQSVKRHAGLLGILFESFAFQITKLALDFLQCGDKRAHDNLSVYRVGVLRETSENACGDRAELADARGRTTKHSAVHDQLYGPPRRSEEHTSELQSLRHL